MTERPERSRLRSTEVRPYFFLGTFFPFLRALERPMAMACLRLFTLPPFPPLPLFAFPRLARCISRFTSVPAPREYFRFRFLAIRNLLDNAIKQERRTPPETSDQRRGFPSDRGTAVVRSALDLALRSVS